jgi:hypothetical protein
LVSVGQDFGSTATQRRLAARLSPAALSARKEGDAAEAGAAAAGPKITSG